MTEMGRSLHLYLSVLRQTLYSFFSFFFLFSGALAGKYSLVLIFIFVGTSNYYGLEKLLRLNRTDS